MLKSQENPQKPLHFGFIVDGNRRWAREKNLPTLKGHQKGLEVVETTIEKLASLKIVSHASFYLFSTENWNRSAEEVGYLMNLAKQKLLNLAKKMAKNNIKCLIFGSENNVSPELLADLKEAEKITKDSTGMTVCICFNYGGKQEILDAANSAFAEKSAPLTLEDLESHLYHPEVPPCDMIIRTSGEERFSGFMLWRAAYSEFLFLKKYWPDLEPADIDAVLAEYNNRSRRFGK